MEKNMIHIKNMVCQRCIRSVNRIFQELDLKVERIRLGEVEIGSVLTENERNSLKQKLASEGFELLEDEKSKIVSDIKSLIIDQIHYKKDPLKVNFSTFLSESLNHDYSSLSKLFSSIEGITIERFIVRQKIEMVKELIFYDQLNLSEIAFQLNYSSVAHLSNQFKKETGMTPTDFRKLKKPSHRPLDSF